MLLLGKRGKRQRGWGDHCSLASAAQPPPRRPTLSHTAAFQHDFSRGTASDDQDVTVTYLINGFVVLGASCSPSVYFYPRLVC
ncbi:hypothetical protein BGZ63DRAFT_389201 [Mariannaea sp. PMI_226]|nr:hypothetical protein BGZ63DRAFT_389201 [Mariannaea sp. PMI_226]